jgi:hypothetical protein
MKKRILVITLIGMSFGIKAQITDTGGNVGIGTENPDSKLSVKGNVKATSYSAVSSSFFSKLDVNNLQFSRDGISYIDNTNANGSIAIRTGGTSNIDFFIKSNGYVGIGTTDPDSKLSVKGNVKATSYSVVNSSASSKLDVNNLQFSRDGVSYIDNKNTNGSIAIRTGGTSNIDFLIKPNGNVGIGTNLTGEHKLAVEGSIGAREIKVEAFPNWSDFVFYKEYNLPSLKEVENHIKEKGHLKDIPSAEEVEENGIFLGEMNAKLLQKIEELTLYTIQQQKEIENFKIQNYRIDKLEKENELLKTMNSKLIELHKRLEKLENK